MPAIYVADRLYGENHEGDRVTLKVNTEGDLDITTSDLYTIFMDILKELKKMNLHMQVMTDITISNEDIEV